MPQTTLERAVICTGVSLHSGKDVSMEFRPAPENTGIVFHVHAEDGEHLLSPSLKPFLPRSLRLPSATARSVSLPSSMFWRL